MAAPLRILHLEDDPADAELVAAALTADGLKFQYLRAVTREQFVTALDDSIDLILSDYAVPGFGGVAAQAIAQHQRPDVPFVYVSGTIGEEVAIDRLKEGATDYVLKQRLSRLGPAVRRALTEAQDRRERARAEDEVRRLNRDMEQRVVERTAQLAEANRELRQATILLDSIVENLPDMMFVKDATDLRFVRFNRAGEQLLGLSRTELIGRTAADIMPPALAKGFVESDRAALDNRAVIDIPEQVIATKTRGARLLHTKKIPILDADGRPRYLLGISEDITERRHTEESARLARLEAERANRAKSEFLSRMSHDLRTPLNAVLGFAQILELDAVSPEQKDSVRQILNGGRLLLNLINEVLDISRIEAGHISLSLESVPVAEGVQHVADLLKPLAALRGIVVSVDVAGGCPPYVRADRHRLEQVLVNLVGNAVKYNRENGTVRIACHGSLNGSVQIRISDSGHGIPPEKMHLLFQPFERLGAETGPVEGTGLGLALSKGLILAMGGLIGVESHVGTGTTFWIDLPQGAPSDAVITQRAAPALPKDLESRGTLLYVEDNRSNVRLLERLIARRRGVRLIAASTGEEGLAQARRARPDLVLLDLHLPDMPGEEVLRLLRADDATREIPVAVLSADATTAQRHRLIGAGAAAYLTKPVDISELLGLIDQQLDANPSETGAEARS